MTSTQSEMRGILKFLIEVSRIKSLRRTGWVWLGVKNPETVAEHSFRLAVMAWLLGSRTNLNVSRLVQTALVHDICESYAGDITPYHGILPQDKRKWRPLLKRWVRLPRKDKEVFAERKFLIEKKALIALLKPLPNKIREELFSLWLDFEKGTTPEGKFVKQLDRTEALLQAIEYFGTAPGTPVVGWWEGLEELVEHPLLLEFLKAVEAHFYRKEYTPFDPVINFFFAAGKLKRLPRTSWTARGVRNPESLANHTFMLALLSLVLMKSGNLNVSDRKVLTLSLLHLFPYVLMREPSPYDELLKNVKTEKERKRIFQVWLRLPFKKKKTIAAKRYRDEKAAIARLTAGLERNQRDEIRNLWKLWKENDTPETRFLKQMYVAEILLAALTYRAEDPKFPIEPWWEWAYEFETKPFLHDFMEALKLKFYPLDRKTAPSKKRRIFRLYDRAGG